MRNRVSVINILRNTGLRAVCIMGESGETRQLIDYQMRKSTLSLSIKWKHLQSRRMNQVNGLYFDCGGGLGRIGA
jgi:hypothetical protein